MNSHEYEVDKKKKDEKIGGILVAQESNNTLLSNLKVRLSRVEKDLQLVNNVGCIQDSLN